MARNKVQFQKGLSEAQFAVLYGTEDQCREAVMRWRWPSGFVCPVCAGEHHSVVKTRALYQCSACRRQTSVIAGTIFAAVETTPEGKPIRLKLRRVKGFRRAEIASLAQRNFHPASTVVSDGLHCFTGVGNAGCVHQPIITGSGRKAALNPAFKWVNTTLGNIKSAITGTYRAIRDKHVPRYLAEFEYRFNRRYDLAAMMPRLGYVAVRTPPMPYRLLKLAEDHA